MARKAKANDSLDLFLDTICNAFGGIIFICILLSLLIQLRDRVESSDPASSTSAYENEDEVKAEIAKLQNERHELESLRKSVRSNLATHDSSELQQVQAEIEVLRPQLSKALDTQSELTLKAITQRNDNKALKDEIDSIDQKLADGKAEVEQLASTVQLESDKREFKVSVPRVRETDKSNVIYMMRYGQIFQVKLRDGQFNSNHVNVKSLLSVDSISPRRDAGWNVDDLGIAEFTRSFSYTDPKNHFISLAVWSDSFDQFTKVKKKLIDTGYEYDLFLIDEMESVTLGAGVGKPSVQ